MTALLAALTLLAVPAQAHPPGQVAPTYRICGVVVDAVTNVPVGGAQVSVSLGNEEASGVAGVDGQFVFEGLQPGKYRLYAGAPGYVREGYNQHGAFLVAVAVGNGLDSEHLIFRLHAQAVIYGRVTDERGEAVRGAQVALFASDFSRGSHAIFSRAQTQTNDLGEYRFAHLLPGKYYLAVQGRPWYGQSQMSSQKKQSAGVVGSSAHSDFVSGSSVDLDPNLDVVYPVTFYPGVTDESSSVELVLTAGDKEEANITLQAVPAVHLCFTVPPGDPGTSIGVGASQRVFGTFSFGLGAVSGQVSPGEYEVAGLPPGDLALVITTNKGNEWTSRTIQTDTSADGTIDGSRLPETVRVSGKILLPESSAGEIAGTVNLLSASPTTSPGGAAQLQKDGTFNFPEIQPGIYRIQANLRGRNSYVQKLAAKQAKVSGREITIISGSDVELTVTLGQGPGQVKGVVQVDGKPVAGVMVLLVPESGQEIEYDSRMDESDSDGTFSLAGVLPGEYILLAIKDGWDLEWAKPDVLRPYLPAGQKMSIAANQSLKVTVLAQDKTLAVGKKPQ